MENKKTEKMTNKKALEWALTQNPSEEVAEKLKNMIASIDKKANAPKKPTATSAENEKHKLALLAMATEAGQQAKEYHKSMEYADEMSVQKTSALLNQLVKEHKLVKETEKGKTLFKLNIVE